MDSNKIKLIRAVTVAQSVAFYQPLVQKLQARGYEVVSLSSPGPELQGLKEQGVKCIEVTMERHISIKRDLAALWNIVKVLRKERPTVIHSMTPKAGMLCMLAAWLCRVPVRIHTFTGLVWPTATGLKRKILMATDWLTCACATHVIPEGRGVMDDLRGHITRKPMRVLGYGNVRGINLERFDRTEEVMREAGKIRKDNIFTFVFVGRIVRDKGINELVSAFGRLLAEHPRVRLVLVGEYEDHLDPILPETRAEIDRNPAIEAVGNQDDVRPWLAAADALVFPSYREGFPNVVIEAGAMGLPAIVTDINGSREIVEDDVNGLIVASKDEDALLGAMKRLVAGPALVSRLSSKAREMVAARYEQGFVQKCLLDFYAEIAEEKLGFPKR